MPRLLPTLPPVTLSPRLITLAGRSSLLSTALLVAGITAGFMWQEHLAVLLVFCAFVALLPLVLTLHELHRPEAGRLNTIARMSGLVGVACFALAASINLLALVLRIPDATFQPFWWLPIVILLGPVSVGLWLGLTSYLALKAETLPLELALVGCGVGLGYISFVATGLIAILMPAVMPFAGVPSLFLMLVLPVGHIIWSLWIGGWLLSLDEYQWEQVDYSI